MMTATVVGGTDGTDTALAAGNAQARINRALMEYANNALVPIFRILHQAPTAAMCADISRVLFDHGLRVWSALKDASETEKPEGTVKTMARYGAPIVGPIIGGDSRMVDLRPPLEGLTPNNHPTAWPPPWRENARKALAAIAEELLQRGFNSTGPEDHLLSGVFASDPDIIVRVWTSPVEDEPFTLALEGLDQNGRPKPLVRGHTTTLAHLLRTVDAFVAGWASRKA